MDLRCSGQHLDHTQRLPDNGSDDWSNPPLLSERERARKYWSVDAERRPIARFVLDAGAAAYAKLPAVDGVWVSTVLAVLTLDASIFTGLRRPHNASSSDR